jgi:tRNA A-37 threonylcarbamoyl transferase component Bud32
VSADYVRRCPSCGADNAPQVMRCACGALLAGVDLVSKAPAQGQPPGKLATAATGAPSSSDTKPDEAATSPPAFTVSAIASSLAPASPTSIEAASTTVCPYEDCAQPNPSGTDTCVYCNRALKHPAALSGGAPLPSLISLPGTLKDRYRILHPLPTQGAQAELLLVQAQAGGAPRVAKIYRHGVKPRADVQQRVARIDPRHGVVVHESGNADGYAYELMEYCAHGSLRNSMRAGPLAPPALQTVVREVADALANVHAVGLLHRDLKPENILVRALQPLELVLTDFGIASVLEATQRFTSTARSLPYASPESLSGVIDEKADYWALGMVVLEAALGQHPFAGLSEAVILHHLTTRSIDLAGVRDGNLRKLLRGLLLRDPHERWGQAEVSRWLADDASLAEPVEHAVASGFAQPYHLAQDVCHTKAQLAVALARNWAAGCQDLSNGLLLAWFRDVQKDQNAMRLLIGLRTESGLPADVQLLKLIVHLAPGIVPAWRGESIELRAILARANAALKGDAPAQKWLDTLHRQRVLAIYANAGNAQCAELVHRWGRACDDFAQAWATKLALLKDKAPGRSPGDYANFDQLMYGQSEPDRPNLAVMHARLLALAYDDQWAQRLRQRLTAELASLSVHCPWLGELGDPHSLDGAALLVLEALLPQAREVAQHQQQANERARQQQLDDCKALGAELQVLLAGVRAAASGSLMLPTSCSDLRTSLDHYDEFIARMRASGRTDAAWLELCKAAGRPKTAAGQLSHLVDALAERRAANTGWLSLPMLGFAALAMLLIPAMLGPRAFYWLLAAALAVLAWRLLPDYFMMREIRRWGDKF